MPRASKPIPRGPRDLSQEQRDYQRRTKRNDVIMYASMAAVIILTVIIAFFRDNALPPVCTGSQSVVVEQGDTLESIIRENVDGINSVDIRDVVEDVMSHNRLTETDVASLQIGSTIGGIPTGCS